MHRFGLRCIRVMAACVLAVVVMTWMQGCFGPPDLPQGLAEHELPDDPARLKRLLEKEPGNMAAWRRLWWLAEEESDRLVVARDCVLANPRSDQAHAVLGAHYSSYGHDVDAEVSLRRALELNAASDAAISLASIYSTYGRTKDAVEVIEGALSQWVKDPEVPVHIKLELATQLNHAGRFDAAGSWAKQIGGDRIQTWALPAYASAGRDFAKIPEPPAWTWKAGGGGISENYGAWGTVIPHSPLVEALRFMAVADSVAEISRIEAWFRKGLEEIDTPDGRRVCLVGLLVASWFKEGLKPEPGVPEEHAALIERLNSIGGIPMFFFSSMTGVPGSGPMLDEPKYFPKRSPLTAIRMLKLGLIQDGTAELGYQYLRFELPMDRADRWILEWAAAEPDQPEFVLAASRVELGRRRYQECIGLAKRVIELLDAKQEKPTGQTPRGAWRSSLIRTEMGPTLEESLRYQAEDCIHMARYYGGEREAVVKDIAAAEAKRNPRHPGQHWILRLDDYWREVEKRGLAKFPGE